MKEVNNTIQARILAQLNKQPERKAITFVDYQGRFSWLTAEEFYRQAAGYSARLRDLGLTSGKVGIIVSVDPEFCAIAVLAMLTIGAVPLLVAPPAIQGINSSLKTVIKHVLKMTSARVALLPKDMSPLKDELKETSAETRLVFDHKVSQSGDTLDLQTFIPSETSVASLQLTSGTTGLPRVCVWQQKQVLAALDGMAEAMKLTPDDVFLNWTPLYHDMGLVCNYLLCLVQGMPIALLNPIDVVRRPALWLRAVMDTGATTTWSPNFGFALAAQRIRDDEIKGVRIDHVRGFWSAAEKIHLSTMKAFYRRFEPYGVKWKSLKACFGGAENIGGATFSDPHSALVAEHVDSIALQKDRVARVVPQTEEPKNTQWIVSCGLGYPGVKLHVLDTHGKPLPDGRIGEVALITPSRLTEYLGQPEETKQAIQGDYLLTGDLGYKRQEEVFWVGRKKERINLHGLKYDPSEFESILFTIDGLRKGCFVAFGIDDEEQGTQKLVIIVEVDDQTSRSLKLICNEVRKRIATELGVTVGEIALVSKGNLTKTSSGKRRHQHFRNLYLQNQLEIIWRTGANRLN